MQTFKNLSSLIACLLCTLSSYALIPAAHRQTLHTGWEFIRQDMGGIWEVMRPVPGAGKPEAVPLWTAVSLPHCYNATDAVSPDVNYYQGPAWYRTSISLDSIVTSAAYADGRIILEFEGAGQQTDVYVYTTHVSHHTGGYDEWTADLTEAVRQFRAQPELMKRFEGKIPLAIRCDNSRNPEMIPSSMSDFCLYGGIYRPLHLIYTSEQTIGRIQIDTRTDEKGKAGEVSLTIPKAFADSSSPIHLLIDIIDPLGKTIFSELQSVDNVYRQTVSVKHPQLWSPDHPQLYICRVQQTDAEGRVLLTHTERFGFRHFRFAEHGPFYLNGQRLLLRGTHRHEDHAGLGAALTPELMRAEMQQIKNMGANFIRLGHYQQSSYILDLCDELGLLVWEEIPWCRGGLGGETYRRQARRMLSNMIAQHRHHPSIILWGMGNENDWPGDFATFSRDSIRSFMSELNALSHQLDPSRLTVIRRCDFCSDVVDVYSPSIWAGWYSRRFTDYAAMERKGFESTPRFLHAEWGGDSHPGRHEETHPGSNPFDIEAADRNGRWSESYIVRLFDWHLKEQEQMPWLTGSLFWTFKDFATPLRPDNPIPYVNQKGVVQRDGTPKESYYVFQSYWTTRPMLHIYGHSWPVRWGEKGEKKEYLVYSNCPEVELIVNGMSQGRKVRHSQDFPAAGLRWEVTLDEGENHITAIGYPSSKQRALIGEKQIADSLCQTYQTTHWGKPAQIKLTVLPDKSTDEYLTLQAEVLDAEGVNCLDCASFIRFGSTHPDALLRSQGTAVGSDRIQTANGRACIKVKRSHLPAAVSARMEGKHRIEAFIQLENK